MSYKYKYKVDDAVSVDIITEDGTRFARINTNNKGSYTGKIVRVREEIQRAIHPYLVELTVSKDRYWSKDPSHEQDKIIPFKIGDRVIGVTKAHMGEHGTVFRTYDSLTYCTIEWDSGVISNKDVNGIRLLVDADMEKAVFIVPREHIFAEPPMLGTVAVADVDNLDATGVVIKFKDGDVYITNSQGAFYRAIRIDDYIDVVKERIAELKSSTKYVKDTLLVEAIKLKGRVQYK